jgi:hypothetical protein
MAGFDNGVVFATNIDLTSGAVNTGSATLLTDGQLLIASTALNAGNTHVNVGVLTSPNGTITIGYSSPNITLETEDSGFVWEDEAGAFGALKNTGYFITGTATATLPAAPAQGDTIRFFVDVAAVLTLQANTGQTIKFASNVSSTAGTQASTASGDACTLVYRAADTRWCATDFVGAWNAT